MQPNFQAPMPGQQFTPQLQQTGKPGRHQGHFDWLWIPLIGLIILFIGVSVFAYMAYAQGQDYKNNSDKKSAQAVAAAEKELAEKKDAEFAEKEKSPYETYKGPDAFGGVQIVYPKTWSAFVNDHGTGSTPVNGYFHPGHVPATDGTTAMALHVEVVEQSYDALLKQFDSQVKSGKVKVSPFAASKVPGTVGSRIDGEVLSKKQGSMILLPLRDKTLRITTEATEFKDEFDSIVLPNLVFVP